MVNELNEAKNFITEKNMKTLYVFLEKKSNEHLVYMMEALVGIMRKQRLADNISVELYCRTAEGFHLGMDRIDIRQLNVDHCRDHLNKIDSILTREFDTKDLKPYQPYLNVLRILCNISFLGNEEAKLETAIEELQTKVEN